MSAPSPDRNMLRAIFAHYVGQHMLGWEILSLPGGAIRYTRPGGGIDFARDSVGLFDAVAEELGRTVQARHV